MPGFRSLLAHWVGGVGLLEPGCPPFDFDVRGRDPIGVAQRLGREYPLIRPSPDVRYLFADFKFTYDDPANYDNTLSPFTPPFRLARLINFGCRAAETSESSSTSSASSASSTSSESANAADLIIVDADDRVVFDSRLAVYDPDTAPRSGAASREWGPRLRIYEWRTETAACFAVVHAAWPYKHAPAPRYYFQDFVPSRAVLDERAVMGVPKRVRSVTAVLSRLTDTALDLAAGYNMTLTAQELPAAGGRRRNRLTMAAIPGAGQGVYRECDPCELNILRINGVAPTQTGHFYLSATGCYWIRQPTGIVSSSPRQALPWVDLYPYNQPDANLPDPAAGESKTAAGWPPDDDPRYAHLQFGNDCQPCCDCDDYAEAAQYMNQTGARYQAIGDQAALVRETYHENRERWLAARECAHARPLRVTMQPQICPYIDVAVQFINRSTECVEDVALTVEMAANAVGIAVPGFGFIVGRTSLPGRTAGKLERYTIGGAWPTFTASWERVQPRASVYARFRLEFQEFCAEPVSSSSSVADLYNVTATLAGTIGGLPVLLPTGAEASATTTATLRCPATSADVKDLSTCAPKD